MRFSTSFLVALCFGAFALPQQLFCQMFTDTPLAVDAHQTRHVLTPLSTHQTLRIFNLLPGQNYTLILPKDERLNGCQPTATAVDMGVQKAEFDPVSHQLKFTAASPTMDFRFAYPCTWETDHPPTHFLSVICAGCTPMKLKDLMQDVATLEVASGQSAEDLVKDVLIGGNCFDIAGVTYDGQGSQIGTFSNGLTNVGFATGMVMATGDVSVCPGPNDQDNASAGFGIGTPDADLGTLTGGATFDMANIEFDFTPTQSPLTFEFVFASEEYCEYVNTAFNDVFGFFISGPGILGNGNIALVPATTTPVAINNVNHLTNSGLYVNNTPASGTLCGQNPANGIAVSELQFDGYTRKMTATANVQVCQTYHIKLKIADVGDGIFDSAVFLKSGSFDAGGNASVEWVVNGNPDDDDVFEGCGTVQLVFTRVGSNPNVPLVVQYTISGTATPGLDYVPIPASVVIPPGQTTVTIPVTILTDALLEGQETVIITLVNKCSCLNPFETLIIDDLPPLQLVADTVVVCGPGIGTVSAFPTGGVEPFVYTWSNGGTTSSISPFVSVSTNYKVTVTDACGKTKVSNARIHVNALPNAQLFPPAPQLCPGQEGEITVNFTGIGPFELVYILNGEAQPPITGITDDPYTLIINQQGLYQIASVTDSLGCVGSGQGALLVTPSTLAMTGVVTNVKCAGQTNGSINTTVTGGQGPHTYAWTGPQPVPTIPDPLNLMAGQYTVTVTDGFGCQNTQTFTVAAPAPILPTIVNTTGPNCLNANGGSIDLNVTGGVPNYLYQWTGGSTVQDPQNLAVGTYTVTVTDQSMCTKTAVATVTGNFTPPLAAASTPGSLSCTNTSLNLSGTGSSTGAGFSYNWTAAPGSITGGGTTLNPTVNQPGTYTLVVTNAANGCTASATAPVTSTVAYPTANAGPNQTLTCIITNLTLNGSGSSQGPNFTYNWTAAQGGTIISGNPGQNPVISTPGLYTLVVTNSTNGCTTTATTTVNSSTAPPASIIGNPALLTCVNSAVTLAGGASTPSGSITYQWTTTNGNIQSGNASASAVVTEPGQYTLIVTNTANGCTHSSTVTVNQDNSVPIANAAVSGGLSCTATQLTINGTGSSTGSNFNLLWTSSTGSGFVSGQNTLMPVVNAPATYTLLITNTTNNCTATASVLIGQNVQLPAVNAGPPATLTCATTTLTIGDANASLAANLAYNWTTAGGNIVSGGTTPTPTVNQPGSYTLVVSNATNGCSNTATVAIGENVTNPTATAAPGGQINCTSPAVQLNGNGSSTGASFSYNWTSSTGGGIGSGATTLTPTVTAAGTYTLVVTNAANGCSSSASATVTTNANLPIAVAAPLGTLTCVTQQIDLSATGSSTGSNFSYQWGTVNGQILSGQGTLQLTVGLPGQYTLIVTNTTNNCTATFAVIAPDDLADPVAIAGNNPTLNCTVPNLQLDGNGSSTGTAFTYLWSGPSIVSGNTTLMPTVNEPGTYQLLVTNTQNGCTTTDDVQVLGDANDPIVQIAAPAMLNCTNNQIGLNGSGSSAGAAFGYQWTGPGVVQGATTLTPTVNAPGTYTLVITNTANGCTSDEVVAVTQDIDLPPADAGPDNTLNCFTPQLQVGGPNNPTGSGYTFTWAGPGIVSGGSGASPIINQGGLYNLTVTNTANGCTMVDLANVATDFVNPQADAGSGAQLTCTQSTFVLNATASTGNNFTYAWTTNTGSFTTPTDVLNPTVNGAGSYSLLVTNTTNGCTATSSVQITKAADVPTAIVNPPATLTCTVQSMTLSGSGSSTGPTFTYQWTSPNGGNIVSGDSTLSPVVDQPGTYFLAVTNTTNNCISNSSAIVDEDVALPAINAGQSPTLTCTVLNLNLQGTVSSNGSFTYLWSAQNGGNIVSGINTLTPLIDAAGTYLLTVTSQQNGCSSTASVAAVANQTPPVSTIQQPALLTCTVKKVVLNAAGSTVTGNMSYVWSTSNGHFIGQPVGLSANVDEVGTYTLLITDTDNGCTDTATTTVDEDVVQPTASAGTNGLLTCAVTSLELNGSGSSQNGSYFYEWTTQNGQILVGGNGLNPTVVAGGTYLLVVVNELNGCTDTDEAVVTTDTLRPTVAIVSPDLLTCIQPQVTINGNGSQGGAGIVYAWVSTNGNIVSGQNSKQVVVNAAGDYTLNVLNTVNGCSSTASTVVTDNIILPIADAGAPATLTCTVEQVTLQGTGSTGSTYTYAWTAQAGGQIMTGGNTPNPVVNQPGTYNLVVTNLSTGCKQTDAVEIFREKNVPSALKVIVDNPSCKNNDGTIQIDSVVGGVGPYVYSIDAGQSYFPALAFENISPGTYNLSIQDANGCEFNDVLIVPQAPTVAVSLIPEVQIDLGDSLILDAKLPPGFPLALIDTVIWTPLDGLTFAGTDIKSLLMPVAKPFKPTEYTVRVITGDQCEASDRILIRVDNEPHIYIPNAFSPWDENNANDIVLIFADGDQIIQVNNFQIYDRWGAMVFYDQNFQPNDPDHGWDGYHLGKLLVPAVFVYYAEIQLIDGRTLLYKGDITLVR